MFIKLLSRIALAILILACSITALAEEIVATLYSSEGQVEVQKFGNSIWQQVSEREEFSYGDSLRVGGHGRAAVRFNDGTLVRFSKNATVTFDEKSAPGKTTISFFQGIMHLFSRESREHPLVKTPTMVAAIHGTEFVVKTDSKRSDLTVIAGAVEGSNDKGSVIARDSEKIVVMAGKAPQKFLVADPYESAQWAFAYPSMSDVSDYSEVLYGASADEKTAYDDLRNGKLEAALSLRSSSWRAKLLQAVAYKQNGQKLLALRTVDGAGNDKASALLLKASLLLSLGEVDSAERALRRASDLVKQAPQGEQGKLRDSIASMQAVILAVNNKQDAASDIITSVGKGSASALLSASYVAQIGRDLKGAYEYAKEAVEKYPNSAAANARFAELELSYDRVSEAEKYLNKALSIDPTSASANTTAGFAALLKNENPDRFFNTALKSDPENSMAHLGLGLSKIQADDMTAGRAEIEKAVHLDPSIALYRSYLGKTYFEENKAELADSEFERAIELDADDPTPYLYRAFNNLARNRVVEALEDVETSIAKNDNRAIFRSELLLDRDAATRSSDLSKVFSELGFNQAAKVEALKSINKDYTNYSAHRMLAGSYNSILDAKSKLSESRTADILAPLSFNVFYNTAGNSSLNEYTALFDKNEQRTGINLEGVTYDDEISGEAFNTGKFGDFGYIVDGSSNAQNGSKDRDYYRHNTARLALQYQPNIDNRFLIDSNIIHRDEKSNTTTGMPSDTEYTGGDVTLAYHGRLAPNSHILAQAAYFKDADRSGDYAYMDTLLNFSSSAEKLDALSDTVVKDMMTHDDVDQVQLALQHVYDGEYASTIFGYEYLFSDVDRKEHSTILYDEMDYFSNLASTFRSRADYALHSNTVYGYTVGHLGRYADLTFGLSFTGLDYERNFTAPYIDKSYDRSKASWKTGLSIYPTNDLTLKTAYFQGISNSALENLRTLEPTFIGGTNQLYNDLPGTISENWSAGFDYKIPAFSYFGGQFVHRNLNTKGAYGTAIYDFDFEGGEMLQAILAEDFTEMRDQDFATAYYYQILSKRVAATLDYLYSKEHLNIDYTQELQRHTVALGLKYFATDTIFTYTQANWREQDRLNSYYFDDGNNDFWTLDLGLGYRIPNRQGIIKAELLNVTDEKFNLDQSLGFYDYIPGGIGGRVVASFNF